MTHGAYHLKELVWFKGWTPTNWLLIDTGDSLVARCTRAGKASNLPIAQQSEFNVQNVTDEMRLQMERPAAGSLAAIMGFDFVYCEGEPGISVINRPLNFPAALPCPEETPIAICTSAGG
jgi:hypothetical protein